MIQFYTFSIFFLRCLSYIIENAIYILNTYIILILFLFFQKTWHKKFCQIFKASKYGIQRLEIYDNPEEALTQQLSQRIITLEACVKIAPSNQPHVFTVSNYLCIKIFLYYLQFYFSQIFNK